MTVDVAIIGAGHLGLVTALGLARAGLTVEVLDTTPPTHLPPTAVHHWSVLPGLAELDVLDRLVERGRTTSSWALHVPATGERIDFDLRELADELPYPFHLHVDEATLREVLGCALVATPGVTWRRGVRLVSAHEHAGGVTLEVATADEDAGASELLRARWVVAADGTSSALRQLVGLGFGGSTWPERCVVAIVDHDFAADGCRDTTFVVDGEHGAVLERVAGTVWRYLFLEPSTLSEDGVGDRLPAVVTAATGGRGALLDWTTWRMHQRSASSFRAGRVLVIGDAAHVTHPVIGFTSISGWFDAYSLTRALVDVARGAHDDRLTHWADERRRVFLDDVTPASLSRKNLVTQIQDARLLDVELDHFRRAASDRDALRDVLMQGHELAAPGRWEDVVRAFQRPEPGVVTPVAAS